MEKVKIVPNKNAGFEHGMLLFYVGKKEAWGVKKCDQIIRMFFLPIPRDCAMLVLVLLKREKLGKGTEYL